MPSGVRVWRYLYLAGGIIVLPLGLGMAISDGMTRHPLDVRGLDGDLSVGLVGLMMLMASPGLRHMGGGGGWLVVLTPPGMMAPRHFSDSPIQLGSALNALIVTVTIAFGVVPH